MGRTPCCEKSGMKKGPWTPEEDQKLLDYIHKHGDGSWRTLPKNAGLERCGKSCRLRWTNYLRPDIKRGRFSFEEEEIIIQLHSVLGNKWSAIAARLPGRTDNEIKNYWNTHIRKKLLRMGIDPVTHTPRLDLLDISSILSTSLYNNSSHQFNASRPVLGLQPVVNPQVLELVTTLLSTQRDHHQNPELVQQNLQENHLGQPDHQFQLNQFHQSFQLNQQVLQPTIEDETQLMQANVQQFESSFTSNLGCQDSNWLFDNAGMAQPNYGYFVPNESISNFVSENSSFQSNKYCNNQHCSLASVLSTPSSSPTPLNSSSTQINSGTEDEKDSYCSDRLMFEIPVVGMDANGFM